MRLSKIAVVCVILLLVIVGMDTLVIPRLVGGALREATVTSAGVPSEIDGVEVGWTQGALSLTGLTLDTPIGYNGDYALRIERLDIDVDVATVFSRIMVVDSVIVDGAELVVEQRALDISTRDLAEHVRRYLEAGEAGESQLFRIRYFRFSDGTARVSGDLGDSGTYPLPGLELRDLGTDEGAPLATIIANIATPLLERASLNTDRLPDALGRVRDRFGF